MTFEIDTGHEQTGHYVPETEALICFELVSDAFHISHYDADCSECGEPVDISTEPDNCSECGREFVDCVRV